MENNKQQDRRDPLAGLSKEERIQLLNDAMDNWLEKKWLKFSKWSLRGILAVLFTYLINHIVQAHWR